MADVVRIRLARDTDLDAVMEVIGDGKRAIAELGIDQWQDGYPDAAAVRADIKRGTCYIAIDGSGRPLGTLALLFGADTDYEAAGMPWLNTRYPYAAIHRCAVATGAGGHGVMSGMFNRALAIARAHGSGSVRCDTHPDNIRMRGFLAKQGFIELGEFNLVSHGSGSDSRRIAYEKPL